MKARDFLLLYDEKIDEKLSENLKREITEEWTCPKCGATDLPDEDQECPKCKYRLKKSLYDDKLRKTWESVYDKVFSKIHGKLMENDLQGTNVLRFVTKLRELGIIKRLRSGRFVEVLKIPKEFVVSAFVEGKEGIKRLRKMAWRRKQKAEYRAKPWQLL